MNDRFGSSIWLVWAGILGAVGVTMGAFGAHLLKPILPLQVMTIFETAVRYHLFHTLALLACALAMEIFPGRATWLRRSAKLFVAGIFLFSGSLYGLALLDWPPLGLLTPLGGLVWIAAWIMVALPLGRGPFRKKK